MIVSVESITKVVKKLGDITANSKQVPGLMLEITDENKLRVCYTDGHLAYTEDIDVTVEDGDRKDRIVLDYDLFKRAIENCQPTGSIFVDNIRIKFEDIVIKVSAEQKFVTRNEDGEIDSERVIATKTMDVVWKKPDEDMKSKLLTRMDYESIFDDSVNADVYNKEELIDALTRASAEKNKTVYFSSKTQNIFVQNTASLIAIPMGEEEEVLDANDTLSGIMEPKSDKVITKITFGIAMNTDKIKSIISVFSNCKADGINVFVKDKFVNMYVNTDVEKVGYWFEMSTASKAHTGAFERYSSTGYKSYQILFLREFLADSISSAVKATKTDKTLLTFVDKEGRLALEVKAGSSVASTSDRYVVEVEDFMGEAGSLEGKDFLVSLGVINDMMKQLKTPLVAMDIESSESTTTLRLAEVDYDKMEREYKNAREQTRKLCDEQGIEFKDGETPTPVELKIGYRDKTLKVRQYTMISEVRK